MNVGVQWISQDVNPNVFNWTYFEPTQRSVCRPQKVRCHIIYVVIRPLPAGSSASIMPFWSKVWIPYVSGNIVVRHKRMRFSSCCFQGGSTMDVVSYVMCHLLSEIISMRSDWSVSNYEPKIVEPRHVDSSSSGRLPRTGSLSQSILLLYLWLPYGQQNYLSTGFMA